jgi:hypothetical protein
LKYHEHGKLLAAEIGLSVPPEAPHAPMPPSVSDPPELEPLPELELAPDEPPLLLAEPPELELPPSPAPGPPFDGDDEPHAVPTAHTDAKSHHDDRIGALLREERVASGLLQHHPTDGIRGVVMVTPRSR